MFKRGKRKSKIRNKEILASCNKSDPGSKWQIEGVIGTGATATVHRAVRISDQQVVAAKAVKCSGSGDLEEFGVEAVVLKSQQHPGIVTFLEAFWHKKTLWLMLELCPGGALDDVLETHGSGGLSEPQLQSVAAQLTPALAFLHERGIWHRDVKAANLLLAADGRVKLTDFASCAPNNERGKKRDTFLGTPYWMAPELIACDQPRSKASYDERIDSWALGVTLIELGDGQAPWQDLSPYRAMIKIVKEPPPCFKDPHIWTDECYDFVEAAVAKHPEDRSFCTSLAQMPFVSSPPDFEPLQALLLSNGAQTAASATEKLSDFDDEIEEESSFGGFSSPEKETGDGAQFGFGFG